MPKPWQINAMIDTVYQKIDIVISNDIKSSKSLLYQLISFIKEEAIILVLPTIVFIIE